MFGLYLSQLKALLWKNWQQKKKSKGKLACEIILPVLLFELITSMLVMNSGEKDYEETNLSQLINPNELLSAYITSSQKGLGSSPDMVANDIVIGYTLSEEPYEKQSLDIIEMVKQNDLFVNTGIQFTRFDSVEAMDEQNLKQTKNKKLLAGIVFDKHNYLNYTLRVSGDEISNSNETPIGSYGMSRTQNETNPLINTYADVYLVKFVPLQLAMDEALIQYETQNKTFKLLSFFGKLSKPRIIYNEKYNQESFMYDIFISLLFIAQSFYFMVYIIKDKESGRKRALTLVGVHSSVFWLSWELIYLALIAVMSVLQVIFFIIDFGLTINVIISFLWILFYGLSNIGFVLFLSSLFKNVKTASLVIVGLYFLIFFGYAILKEFELGSYEWVRSLILTIIPHGNVARGMNELERSFRAGIHIGLANLPETKFGQYFLYLIINTLVYHALAILIEFLLDTKQIFKFKHSVKFDVPLTEADETENEYSMDIQADPDSSHKCAVEVKNLYKVFKNTDDRDGGEGQGLFTSLKHLFKKPEPYYAVNNVSFRVYENEIFGILGHNGAGKTTLIQTMTGSLKADHGVALYDGMDASNLSRSSFRNNFGICSQDNIFYEELSVEDHIKLFSKFKNVEVDIDELLNDIDLTKKRYANLGQLSGGQKRKFCIALATIGNPKYIFLDEPTTGLDPFSRRKIWEYLMKIKKNRVIFLTTHFMDEADVLADRKMILSKGKIRCLGSSLYLKKHFNIKYSLNIETNSTQEDIGKIIKAHIPEAECTSHKLEAIDDTIKESDRVYYSVWKLPVTSINMFSTLFKELEKLSSGSNGENNLVSVKRYSFDVPSLEELFVKLEDGTAERVTSESEGQSSNAANAKAKSQEKRKKKDTIKFKNRTEKLPKLNATSKPSTFTIIYNLMSYRFKIYLKKGSYLLYAVLIPSVLLYLYYYSIGGYIKNNQVTKFDKRPLSSKEMYQGQKWNYDIGNSSMNSTINLDMVEKEFINNQFIKDSENKDFIELHTTKEIEEMGKQVKEEPYYVSTFSGDYSNNNTLSFNIYYNDSMPFSIPTTLNSLSNAVLASYQIDKTIEINTQPFTTTDLRNSMILSTLFISLFYIVCMGLSISFFGPLVLFERKTFLLNQFHLNGVSKKNYWIATFVTDYILFFFTSLLITLAGYLSNLELFRDPVLLCLIIFTSMVWAVPTLLFQYVCTFMMKSVSNSQMNSLMINVLPAIITIFPVTVSNIMGSLLTDYENINLYGSSLPFYIGFTVLYPPYGLEWLFNSYSTLKMYNSIFDYKLSLGNLLQITNGITPAFLSLILSAVFYGYRFVQSNKALYARTNFQRTKENLDKNLNLLKKGDLDVYNEFLRITKKENKDANIPVRVVQLGKEFNSFGTLKNYDEMKRGLHNKNPRFGESHITEFGYGEMVSTALDNVTFGIDPHECFGLLGPNGAGKSTLLRTVANVHFQTVGEIYLDGKSNKEIKEDELSLGFCPQIDTLWPEFTVFEHVYLFLKIRGYNKKEAKKYANQIISCCGLTIHKNKKPAELSGGTRRKLCLMISLCCSSGQIVLDEPTSGVDPATRRFIWSIVEEFMMSPNASIILTTHSMEEAELLCHRIGILVNGRLQCIGTSEHLKMKFGNGYTLEVQTDNIDGFHKRIILGERLFQGNTYHYEKLMRNRIRYEVQMSSNISRIFEIMEQCKKKKMIDDYSFSQISLDQIFLNVAKHQENLY